VFKKLSGGFQSVNEKADYCDLMGAGDSLPKMGTWILLFIGLKSKKDWRSTSLLRIAPGVMARRQDMTN